MPYDIRVLLLRRLAGWGHWGTWWKTMCASTANRRSAWFLSKILSWKS